MIVKTKGVCGGCARIDHTRIPVWTLVALRQLNMNDAQLLKYHPDLNQDDLDQSWEYYEKNQEEIDREISKNSEIPV